MWQTLYDILEQGQAAVLATIVFQQGSAPRGAGSQLVVSADGRMAGTVGGGLVEARTLEACRALLRDGISVASVLDFSLDGSLAARSDMICGGHVRVLLEPCLPDAPTLAVVGAVRDSQRQEGCLLARPFPPQGERPALAAWTLLRPDGREWAGAPLPTEARRAWDARAPRTLPQEEAVMLEVAGGGYFVEACLPPCHMIIAGGGHVSRPTAQVAALAGFAVTVLDDRAEYAAAARFPTARQTRVTPGFTDCFDALCVGERTYIIIVTRGHVFDGRVLAQALRTPARYIGMIGSRRKREEVYAALRREGFTEQELRRVHCPVGLPIGAETPEEIAVSIVAQCIACRRGESRAM